MHSPIHRTVRPSENGYSMVELMISMAIFLIISSGLFGALGYYMKDYQRTQLTVDMHDNLRSAIDLMAQEIGQAGLLSSNTNQITTLGAAVATGSQTVAFGSAATIFVGEKLLIDAGSNQELVSVTAVSSNNVTAVFGLSHASGAVVNALGVFPQGVLSSSTANQLQLVGDINGDGTLVYVEYNCNNQAPGPGTLTRSITPISAAAKNASTILLDKVMPNPGGTACFQYGSAITAGGSTFIPQVGVTMTVQSSTIDPVTGVFLTITKQALDLVPRNVQMGVIMASASPALTTRLQPTPPGIPIVH
jgi:prepilin-type N-terminal cleavage/methylation domain-containing protein